MAPTKQTKVKASNGGAKKRTRDDDQQGITQNSAKILDKPLKIFELAYFPQNDLKIVVRTSILHFLLEIHFIDKDMSETSEYINPNINSPLRIHIFVKFVRQFVLPTLEFQSMSDAKIV
jgi:hypothetical protein